MSTELVSSIRNFQELLLLCRPREPIAFATQFYNDEKSANSHILHSIQALPYLIYNQAELKNFACSIFCYYTSLDNLPSDSMTGLQSLEIITSMRLSNLWIKVNSIEEVKPLINFS
jgi:hypothetical protein